MAFSAISAEHAKRQINGLLDSGYVVEMFDDYAIVYRDGMVGKLGFTISDGTVEVEALDDEQMADGIERPGDLIDSVIDGFIGKSEVAKEAVLKLFRSHDSSVGDWRTVFEGLVVSASFPSDWRTFYRDKRSHVDKSVLGEMDAINSRLLKPKYSSVIAGDMAGISDDALYDSISGVRDRIGEMAESFPLIDKDKDSEFASVAGCFLEDLRNTKKSLDGAMKCCGDIGDAARIYDFVAESMLDREVVFEYANKTSIPTHG